MTHFDFKCLLPALLHVEDRMSMAHGLESRVPLLDHKIVEFAARVPADIKFRDGNMKHLLKTSFHDVLPREIRDRRDKMGFPVPLKEWLGHDVRGLVVDTFENLKNRNRPHFNAEAILANFDQAAQFSRKNWALFSLELWHQQFHDRAHHYRKMIQH
jgi:asparagine synthase (glutamine-hydrolysing)